LFNVPYLTVIDRPWPLFRASQLSHQVCLTSTSVVLFILENTQTTEKDLLHLCPIFRQFRPDFKIFSSFSAPSL